MSVPQNQGDGQAAGNILLALLADLELDPENRVEAAPRARDTNQAEEGGGSMMRRMWRRLVQKWQEFRKAGHKALVLHRHLEGRCTWKEEPSHGSFRWRTCEWCSKQEYMADTSARWTPVPPTAPVPQLRGAIGSSPVSEADRQAMYARYPTYRPVHHLDGHQIIGYTLDDVRAGDIAEVIPERPAA